MRSCKLLTESGADIKNFYLEGLIGEARLEENLDKKAANKFKGKTKKKL